MGAGDGKLVAYLVMAVEDYDRLVHGWGLESALMLKFWQDVR